MEDRCMEASCLRYEEGEHSQWCSNVHEFLRRRLEDGNGGPCVLKVEGPLACSIQEQFFPCPENLCAASIDVYFDQDGGEGKKNVRQIKVKNVDEQQNLSDHLLCACTNGSVPALCAVMDSNRYPDLNTPLRCANSQELTPLSISALAGSWDCCSVLLQRGADIAAVGSLGRCALHWAVIAGQADVVKQLIREGAPVGILDQQGFSPICLGALSGSKEIVNLIMRQNVMPDTPHLPTGATPLMLACGRGNHAVTKAMLKCHADINARDQLGHTALHCAVWGGNLKCVKAVHTQSSYAVHDHFGRTAFHLAASKGNTELCNYFLSKGSNWNELDGEGRNCVHWAVLSGVVECVAALVTHKEMDGKFLCRQQDIWGSTPLHYTAITESTELFNLIFGKCEELSPVDTLGWTPLSWAALCGRTRTVSRLLEAKVPVTCPGSVQPLHSAAGTGADEPCRLMVECGAEVNVQGPQRWTPLHYASRFGHAGCVGLLLSSGAMVDSLTEELQTPLHNASSHGHTSILCQLLAAGASKDMPCPPNGESPSHLAARNGRTSILEVLLNSGCGLDTARTSDGRTLLHLASMGGHLECCQLLVQRGANTSLRDSTVERYTALDLAMLSSHNSCSVFLMSVHAPSGGGRYHRAALTIQAVWRFSRHKRRRNIAKQWAAMVLQRAYRRVRLQRRAQRLRQVRARARNMAASTIQHHWRGYIEEKRRYEATYARLKARLQQERAAAGIIMHELNSHTHNMQLPSTATRQKPATSVSKFLLQAAAQPSVAMASGAILFPREAPKLDLGARSKTAPSPAFAPGLSEERATTSAVKEVAWSGDEEMHVEIHNNTAPTPKVGHPGSSPKVGHPGSSPKAGHPGSSPNVGRTSSCPKFGHTGSFSNHCREEDTTEVKTSDRHVLRPAIHGGTTGGWLPHLPNTTSLVAAGIPVHEASRNSGRVANGGSQRVANGGSQRACKPPSEPAIVRTRSNVFNTRSPTRASQTVQGQMSTSPGRKTQEAKTVKGSGYVNKQKGAWGSVEQEVLTTAQRYSELNKILCALKQAQASPNLATELSTADLKEHIRTTLNEAVRLRADTEVLKSRLDDSTTSGWVTS